MYNESLTHNPTVQDSLENAFMKVPQFKWIQQLSVGKSLVTVTKGYVG